MNPATSHFVSTAVIATALQAQLQLVQLPNAGGPAFQRVELFDGISPVEAFQVLLISQQTIAIVVPMEDRWQDESSQRKLVSRRVQPVAIIISDRVLGNRTQALYGGPTNQGAYGLVALAIPFISGQLIANPNGVIAKPQSSSTWHVSDKDKPSIPGRAGIVLEVECQGGWIEAPLDAGPTL